MTIHLVDSHCHLDMLDTEAALPTIPAFIDRAMAEDVGYFLNVCVSISEFSKNLQTAMSYSNVVASVGLHPNDQDEEVDLQTLIDLAQHEKVVAIGETGLDYYRSTGDIEWQKDRFRRHIHAARTVKKPLIIHTRAAKQDTINILREEKAQDIGGVIHCFTEDWEFAKQALDLGFFVSFSGIVTFKNALDIQDAAGKVPMDRMLIETDCPYLAPVPKRGKPNEPAYLRHTAEFLAKMRQLSLDEFAATTTSNFFALFKGAVNPYV